ncbi:hypothetical protein [Mesorhizobium sp. M1B.F.Ca.ET.045.04.1.1]|uniref:hypothetical protein n=1 Tax=Mesorhizobium sp. M1B.F.Ca.ET.045.04.1.1 TaxID=2493673 RepID=UPI000F76065D|nr:hypothetical protein [Mesorhizobium sp. M1B.F.Ca.ET.045.04.1.1]AZO29398.1 hypothetical protein EJ071_19725 [Mesorhizobium sp. M1B.F.Ca.ET.045.04.1.1]
MKHTITITFDDEAKIVEVVETGGKATRLRSAIMTVERKPVEDTDGEPSLYRKLKRGPEMEIHIVGLVHD